MKPITALLAMLFIIFMGLRCTHTQHASKEAENVDVMVLESIGGTALEGATISVYKSGVLIKTAATDAGGKAAIALKDGTYDFVAEKPSRAESRYQDFLVSEENRQVFLYCHAHGMVSFPTEAPEIVSVEYSTDGAAYQALEGSIEASALNYLKIAARGKCAIENTSLSGDGIVMNFNGWAYKYEQIMPTSFGMISFPSDGYFITEALYDLSALVINGALVDLELVPGEHTIDVVGYDVANNRVETRVEFELNGTPPVDPDISSVVPVIDFFEAKTFGVSRDLYGFSEFAPRSIASLQGESSFQVYEDSKSYPASRVYGEHKTAVEPRAFHVYDGESISGYIVFYFIVNDGTDSPVPLRGIKVYRSENGKDYKQVYNKTLGTLASEPIYEFIDCDPMLQAGVSYYYKIRAYNASGETQMSEPVSLQLLPPYHLELTAPSNNSTSSLVSPSFLFTVSEPSFFSTTDGFVFSFIICEKTAQSVMYSINAYQAATGNFIDIISDTPVTWITVSNGIVSIDLSKYGSSGFLLERGKTYEWNIFLSSFGPYFYTNYYDAQLILRGRAYTYSTNDKEGYGSSNGMFTLTIDEAAQ